LTIGGGGVLGYFIANKYNKSKTLGVVLGIGATLGSLYVFRIYEKNERNKRMINEGLLPKLNVNTIQKDNALVPKDIIYDTANYNSITHKSPILGGTIGNIKYHSKNGKFYKQQIYPNATIPIELKPDEWMDEFVSNLPF